MTRGYVLDVLGWPRDDKGRPVFAQDDAEMANWAADRAGRMGLPHSRAASFVGRAGR